MEGRKGDTKRGTMTKTRGAGEVRAEGRERDWRDQGGSKIVYNEEAAGRPGTGSSHYRRSSSATRLSVLVARHANVERPARCTCSRTAHRSSVTAAPHTRTLPISLRASSSHHPRLPLFFLNQRGCFVPSAPFDPSSSRSSPLNLVFSFLLEQANVFRVYSSSSSSSSSTTSTSSTSSASSAGANERADPVFLSPSLPFSHDRFTTRVVSPVLIPATRVRRSLSCTPADRTHTGVAHYPI